MADKDARGGGLGWLILGLLIGVVGTLVTQKIVQSGEQNAPPEVAPSAAEPASAVAPESAVKPKLVVHAGGLSGAPAKSAAAVEQTQSEVEDDAAAAGMTSRAPKTPQPAN